MLGQGTGARGVFEDLDRGGIAGVDLDRQRKVALQDAVDPKTPAQARAARQDNSQVGEVLVLRGIEHQRPDTAAVVKRSRVQPCLSNELTSHTQKTGPRRSPMYAAEQAMPSRNS